MSCAVCLYVFESKMQYQQGCSHTYKSTFSSFRLKIVMTVSCFYSCRANHLFSSIFFIVVQVWMHQNCLIFGPHFKDYRQWSKLNSFHSALLLIEFPITNIDSRKKIKLYKNLLRINL